MLVRAFILVLLGWAGLFTVPQARAEAVGDTIPPAPRGARATVDSDGNTAICWAYPGIADTIYRSGVYPALRGMYVSAVAGAHQVAVKFQLSNRLQVIRSVDVWICAAAEVGETFWEDSAAVYLGLATDSAGIPATALIDNQLVFVGRQELSREGGWLAWDVDASMPPLKDETIWLLVTWLPEMTDRVLIGVDSDAARFQGIYRVEDSTYTSWQPWVSHNIISSLHTCSYSAAAGTYLGRSTRLPERSNSDPQLVIQREEFTRTGRFIAAAPLQSLDPYTGYWVDSATFAERSYTYTLWAEAAGFSSVSQACTSRVDRAVRLVFYGREIGAQPDGTPKIIYPVGNEGDINASVLLLSGWAKSLWYSGHLYDSIPMTGRKTPIYLKPGESANYYTYMEINGLESEGSWEIETHFRLRDISPQERKLALVDTIFLTRTTGILDTDGGSLRRTAKVDLYPNPASREIYLSGSIPPANHAHALDFSLRLAIYDILGRERMACRLALDDHCNLNRRIELMDDRGTLLPSGLYFLIIDGFRVRVTKKFVIIQ